MRLVVDELEPFSLTPNWTREVRIAAHALSCFLSEPFGRSIDIALRIREQQVHMRRFDRGRNDAPVGLKNAAIDCSRHSARHCRSEKSPRVLHSFARHALAHWITRMKVMWLEEADLLIPCGGPVSARVAR